ncbi:MULTISPECIES: tail assembly protein [unclassified Leisingera]|uniref:tail assembly protein n=1 Tax=unclassified Leisingera TaxID=2614906 RepID=UPI0002F4AB35|nr:MULTISPECIES: tail assembly protein [unclassified Leisingera]
MSIQKVMLYGHLAEKFGGELPIKGNTPTRVIQIIEANFHGQFYNALKVGEYFVWSERADGTERGYGTAEDLTMSTSDEVLHIMPRIEGASSNKGGITAVLGLVLIGVAIVASNGAAAGLVGSLDTALASGGLASTAAHMGIGMALSGIGLMLSPMPELNIDNDPDDQQQSYILGGPINTMSEGGAIPVIYGAPIVGSTVISAGVSIELLAVDE